ncbi:unnamed protein product, partial [Iphiclides podalirius]
MVRRALIGFERETRHLPKYPGHGGRKEASARRGTGPVSHSWRDRCGETSRPNRAHHPTEKATNASRIPARLNNRTGQYSRFHAAEKTPRNAEIVRKKKSQQFTGLCVRRDKLHLRRCIDTKNHRRMRVGTEAMQTEASDYPSGTRTRHRRELCPIYERRRALVTSNDAVFSTSDRRRKVSPQRVDRN